MIDQKQCCADAIMVEKAFHESMRELQEEVCISCLLIAIENYHKIIGLKP